MANAILQHTRDSDTLCRWGGEEFVLLLDNCTSEAAMQRAEIIRNGVKAQVVAFGRAQLTVTLSLGVTTYHQGESADALVARADTALYQAKEAGRDRSVLAQ